MGTGKIHRAIICLFTVTWLNGVQGVWIIREAPSNTAVRLGQPAQLNCTVDKQGQGDGDLLIWDEYQTENGAQEKRIYSSYNGGTNDQPALYGVEGEYNLIIKEVVSQRAGRYRCSLFSQAKKNAYVIGMSDTRCSYTGSAIKEEEDETTLMCEAEYHSGPYNGIFPPNVRWIDVNGQMTNVINRTEANPDDTTKTTARFVANVTVNRKHHNTPFRCDLFFENKYQLDGGAPEYTDSCSTQFQVRYKTNRITFYPNPDEFEQRIVRVKVNEQINCTGDGNPEPTIYEWRQVDSESYRAGQVLPITSDMVGKENKYRCVAKQSYNGIADVVKEDIITFFAEFDNTGGANSKTFSLLTVFLGFILANIWCL